MWGSYSTYIYFAINNLIPSLICNKESLFPNQISISQSVSVTLKSHCLRGKEDRAVVRDEVCTKDDGPSRGCSRKEIGSRKSDFGRTYFGVCDVVGRHGLGNGLQGAPHASGHCRPASFTPASDPRPPPPTLCRRTLFSPHAWNKGRTATLRARGIK